MNSERETTPWKPLEDKREWSHLGIALGFYPFDWTIKVERFERVMTTFSLGPIALTIHHF